MLAAFVMLLVVLGFIGAIAWMARSEKPLVEHVTSRWAQRVDGLQARPSEVYKAIEAEVREQNMPGVVMKVVSWNQAGILSDKRDYLRIRWGDLTVDLCVAPFGNGVFISSWLSEHPKPLVSFLFSVPLIRFLVYGLRQLFDPVTYYKIDSASMFMGAVQSSVLKVIDQLTAEQGLDPIPEADRAPRMRELYGRAPQHA